jgi:hypothetical protein
VDSRPFPFDPTPTLEDHITLQVTRSEVTQDDPFHDLFNSESENNESETTTDAALSNFLTSGSESQSPFAVQATLHPNPAEGTGDSFFDFFLSELSKCFPYVHLFPWTAARLFSSSDHSPALRHSVLAVAALVRNKDALGQAEALDHLQQALQLIRVTLLGAEVDEGIAISSFMLSHFSMMLGDPVAVRKHLKGMSVALQRLNYSFGPHKEMVPSPLRTDELTMLIWRMAIRLDFISSIASGKNPILPK